MVAFFSPLQAALNTKTLPKTSAMHHGSKATLQGVINQTPVN
jgi:hypothetical protein